MKQNNVIVSGATGFVGQNLLPFLETKNWNITPLSRKRENSISLDYNNLTVTDFNSAYAFIHLAGKAHDLKKTSKDEEYFEVNTELTKKLFNLFLESNAKIFIYFSSVKAVADEVKGILKEDHPYEPETVYGKSKALAEQYLLSKTLPSDKKLYILRPCMIHGPGNKGNLNLLYNLISKGIPYPLGVYKNKRSYLAINNLCNIIHRLIIQSPVSGIYNVADDYPLSTVEVTECISITLHKTSRIYSIPKPFIKLVATVGTFLKLPLTRERLHKLTENYVVSNEKIRSALQIEENFDTKDGLLKTINFFKNER